MRQEIFPGTQSKVIGYAALRTTFRSHTKIPISEKLLVIMEVQNIVSLTARVMSTFATNTFFGASFYINLVETPAKLSLNSTSAMVDQFQETFPRAMSMQFKLVVVSSVGSTIGWFLDKSSDRNLLLYSSLFMIFIIPWTKIKIMPINNQLIDGEYPKKKGDPWVKDMMRRWDRVHFVRTMSSCAAVTCLTIYWVRKSL